MSVKSSNSIPGGDTIVRAGYLKKLKTFKKKYFVLRAEGPDASARLEYYDSDKKFNNGHSPKRSIPLKTCFNINKRVDTKHKHVIALYTKDDCFCMVLESEDELEAWLKALLSLQHGEEAVDGETPRPTFEHIWQVTVLNRGLGGTSVMGAYTKGQDSPVFRLCLTDRTLSLIRKDRETPQAELSLSSIRSCGSLKNYFYLEVGRSSVTGAGELWMETEDSNIAQNVHTTVFHAMSTSSNSKDELGPPRIRSSSATESSKPGKKQSHSGSSKYHHTQGTAGGGRERCDSMPSRPRTSSEGTHPMHNWVQPRSYLAPHRPQSLYAREVSHSPPAESPVSPPSAPCSIDSAGSSLSIDDSEQWAETDAILGRYGHSLTPDEAIAEENYDECPDSPYLPQGASPSGYLPMAPISSDDGYVDMSPRGRHTNMSPAASTSSITSGTPSTDMRFAEYPLEKVSAYFTPSEEETSSTERPIRAYSVGSRPDTIKNKSRVEMSTTPENSRVRAFSVGSKSRKLHTRVLPVHGTHVHPKPKSSSAPLLSGSRTLSSHNDDLMEMDFSKPPSSSSGYMDMNPVNKVPSGYVEMKPGIHDTPQTPEVSPYVDMRSGSSPARSSLEYVDMDPRRTNRTKDLVKPNPPQANYMDMSKTTLSASPSENNALDYMDMAFQNNRPMAATDGYVEMSLGRHHRQSSLDGSTDDYTNMSVGSSKKKNKKEKTRSQPISIQTTNASQFPKSSSSISPVYSSLHIGRKYSTGTPPKMYLPLTNSDLNSYSSLPRQRSRKNSRRDSKDSSSSSVTTPSSSSTIFPISLNSPSSPLKPPESTNVKIPSAVLNAKYDRSSDYTVMDFDKSKNSNDSDYVNYNPANPVRYTRNDGGGDYAVMRPGTLEIARPEPVVSSPSTLTTQLSSMALGTFGNVNRTRCFIPISENRDDTRLGTMSPKPGDVAPKAAAASTTTAAAATATTTATIAVPEEPDYCIADCQSPVAKISRPNSRGEAATTKSSLSRPSSASSELGSSSSTIVGSRPASVNSDKVRPGSVNVEGQLHYASLDLAPTSEEEGGNRSPRTVKNVHNTNDATNTSPTQSLPETGFTYAEIDFIKSEGFKHNALNNNAKVKH